MDTVRVNICYCPLRISRAINSGEHTAFRATVAFSNTMCGGRYNPIAIIDQSEQSENMLDPPNSRANNAVSNPDDAAPKQPD